MKKFNILSKNFYLFDKSTKLQTMNENRPPRTAPTIQGTMLDNLYLLLFSNTATVSASWPMTQGRKTDANSTYQCGIHMHAMNTTDMQYDTKPLVYFIPIIS